MRKIVAAVTGVLVLTALGRLRAGKREADKPESEVEPRGNGEGQRREIGRRDDREGGERRAAGDRQERDRHGCRFRWADETVTCRDEWLDVHGRSGREPDVPRQGMAGLGRCVDEQEGSPAAEGGRCGLHAAGR